MIAYKALQYLVHYSNKQPKSGFNSLNNELKSLFISIFIDFLSRQTQNLDELLNKFEKLNDPSSRNKSSQTVLFHLEMRFDYLEQFLLTLHSFTNLNTQFVAKYFENNNSIRILFQYLGNKLFRIRLAEYFTQKKNAYFESFRKLFELLVKIVFNLSRYFTKLTNSTASENAGYYVLSRKSWTDSNATQILSDILAEIDFLPDTRIIINLILANLSNDDESGDKSLQERVIFENVMLLQVVATQIFSKYVMRVKINNYYYSNNFECDEPEVSEGEASNQLEVAGINEVGELTIIDVLNCLYNMALNDNLKFDLYEKYNVKVYLRQIILNGNMIEKEHSIKLLWLFCFENEISKSVKEDSELIDYIQNLLRASDESRNKRLKHNCKGVLWLMADHIESESKRKFSQNERRNKWLAKNSNNSNNSSVLTYTNQVDKHIMISYNKDSRDICLKIKEELENAGFTIWIDVENISGSSLESMAHGIEQSECVLICMSQKYKESLNCRAESEYVFQTKKPFIPLIMEPGYKVSNISII